MKRGPRRGRRLAALLAATVLLALCGAGTASHAGPPAPPLDFSALIAAARISGPLSFCGEPVDLALPDVRERMEREMLITLWDPPQVILWLKRSRQYLEPIEEELRRQGLPDDLKYVAVAESALRPHAGSARGAMGFWQFMEPTGRKYGLKIDSEKDGRRNLQTATEAALAYLTELHAQFGSWTLAVAAYNMGEYGMQAEIDRQDTRDYYRLYLPLETQRYVFRILTAKRILTEPGRYGFHLQPEDIYPAREFERVTVTLEREVPLMAVARAANTYLKMIKDLNPELRGYRLAAGDHALLIPKGAGKDFQARLKREMLEAPLTPQENIVYVVKEGDNLTAIADRFNVSLSELAEWNRLDVKRPIHPGMRLVIFNPEPGSDKTGR
jgi:hypothetical protein